MELLRLDASKTLGSWYREVTVREYLYCDGFTALKVTLGLELGLGLGLGLDLGLMDLAETQRTDLRRNGGNRSVQESDYEKRKRTPG